MQREGDSARLPLDVEIERLCEALVNLAADWCARQVSEEERSLASGSRRGLGWKRARACSGQRGVASSCEVPAVVETSRRNGVLADDLRCRPVRKRSRNPSPSVSEES